ncbi:MAG: formylglycine-generating enzyme family protein [Nitrospirae bacterium]|nr:formylglycine-generating enzyme family protein [Nitrospirota bacterium]MBF0535680.1 formylglycine-generating enzyme family protein [Nitrospirota bacterium]MBF0617505.1 formylglycine-generating enzyme family protein [Nitrospirota bacterium]
MEFVLVKGGCYKMGDTSGDKYEDETPVHEVCVDDFYIGKYEVTQGQWTKIMECNPSYFKSGDNYPIETVSWTDVKEFINKLNERTGKKYRLPTEAKWEYAARSGGKKEKWAGTNDDTKLCNYAWYNGNSNGETHPVGQKLPNALGLFDMSGNVWEWLEDVYDEDAYTKHSLDNPIYTGGSSNRVIRGGSWNRNPQYARCYSRRFNSTDYRSYNIGFRLEYVWQTEIK